MHPNLGTSLDHQPRLCQLAANRAWERYMNDDILNELVNLNNTIKKQIDLQDEANGLMRELIGTLKDHSVQLADLELTIIQKKPGA